MSSPPRRILIVCPQCDGEDVGESWCGFQWVSRIAQKCDVTVLTLRFPGHRPPSAQLTGVRVVEWDAIPYLSRWPRINSSLKPWYPIFYLRAKGWIRRALGVGQFFDLLHHITPMAMRYPSPCARAGVPYLIGPIAGGLATPPGFLSELGTEPFYARLRNLDALRLRYDPLMRSTYEDAKIVVCSGPYAKEKLSGLNIKRFEIEPEIGVDNLAPPRVERNRSPGEVRMLYVGRIVRTKGLRDAIRAMARLRDLPYITLDVAGAGEDLVSCQQEAETLGVGSRVRFLGKLPRSDVERLYREADLFLFPSFREPTGIVLFEAMRHGLPIITTNRGGPGHIVTDKCGIRVDVRDPSQFSSDLAAAIRHLVTDPVALSALIEGARTHVAKIGLWDRKIERMIQLYGEVAEGRCAGHRASLGEAGGVGAY